MTFEKLRPKTEHIIEKRTMFQQFLLDGSNYSLDGRNYGLDGSNHSLDGPNYDMDGPNYDLDNPNCAWTALSMVSLHFFFCVSVLRLLGGLRRLASAKPKRKKKVGGRLTIIIGKVYCH